MKYILLLLVCVATAFVSFCQSPNAFSYQGVVRNSSNGLIANTTVQLRFSIHNATEDGTIIYQETQNTTTNQYGMFAVQIGMGTILSGEIRNIKSFAGVKYIQTEINIGEGYINMETRQLLSVPFVLEVPPVIGTGAISFLNYNSAIFTDTITSTGGELIIARGVCIDSVSSPSIDKAILYSGNSASFFSMPLTGLLPDKIYYLRGFATNKDGTGYGNIVSFHTAALSLPVVYSDTISSITNTAAIAGGTITDYGGSDVTARGVCYSPTINPTTANGVSPSGSGIGHFTTVLNGLSSSTVYYVRAFATNSTGTAYGEQKTFTTTLVSVPSITTDSVTAISYTTAVSGINTSNTGGSTITTQGICWSTSPNPTTINTHATTTAGVGHFAINITGLMSNTLYYVRAYSTNSAGTAYGYQYSFTTRALSVPTIATNPVIAVSATSATSGGNISDGGGSTVSARGVCWGVTTTPTKDSSHTSDGTSTGTFNSNAGGLLSHTLYYLRAYATNSTGTAYGNVISFTTDTILSSSPSVPVVGTTSATMSTSSTASSGGYVSNSPGSPVSAYGICWNTTPTPTIFNAHTTDGAGLGYYTSIITSLSGCGNIYYIRAYATNTSGTGYGNQQTLITGLLPVISDTGISNITTVSASCNVSIISDGGCTITQKGICWAINVNPTTSDFRTLNGSGTSSFTASMTGLYSNYTYHMRTYATNSLGTTYGPDETFTTGIPTGHYIGESYAGGIVFYIDGSGNHGLVCAPSDQGAAVWGCMGTTMSCADTSVGSGQSNTVAILANCFTSGIAAQVCDNLSLNGYSDWFLPSSGELNLMYARLFKYNIGSFPNTVYHTSSELNSSSMWKQFFGDTNDGLRNGGIKTQSNKIRAVRAF